MSELGSYERVGAPLDPRDIELSIEAATRLHDHLTQEYFPWLMSSFPRKVLVPQLTETRDVLAFGASFGPYKPDTVDSDSDLDVSSFTGIRLVHDQNAWSLRARVNRSRMDLTDNKTSVTYAVDVLGSFVVQARVGAEVADTNSDAFFATALDENLPTPPPTRKAYERHMNFRDCFRLQRGLRRAAHRRLVSARR